MASCKQGRGAESHDQASKRLWFPIIAPLKGMALGAFFAIAMIAAAGQSILEQPVTGIIWIPTPDNQGLIIKKADARHSIPPGTTITGLKSADGRLLPLHNGMLTEDPDQYATYSGYNNFFAEQHRLMGHYSKDTVILVGRHGRQWNVFPEKRRTMDHLPLAFWLLNLTAATCFLIGTGIWLYRRGSPTGRLLGITGLCYFLSILCLSVYGSREIVMDPVLFRQLSSANHLFTLVWCYSLLLMLVVYPSRMAGWKAFVAGYMIAVAIWLNQTLQWVEVPVHAYYGLTHLATYLLALTLGCLQWRLTAHRPVERAVMRWFLLSILISIGMAAILFVAPAVLGHYGVIPLWVPALSVLLMFIGFGFGILRCGLFNLERWWFTGWVWLASGLLITAIDGLLILVLRLSVETLLPYSILLLGWVYFPLRRWLWLRLEKPETYHLEHHLPVLIQSLIASGSIQSFMDRWSDLLKQVFNPQHVIIDQEGACPVRTGRHGLELQIPGLDGSHCFRLTGNRGGTRLFGPKDVELVQALLSISQGIYAVTNRTREVQQKGADNERERIMRDLHDDVLPKLITIKHQSPTREIAKLAETAFQSIRETIYILRHPSNQPLENALADWREELAERLEPTPLRLVWKAPEQMEGCYLTARQLINCGRILREAVSNIIHHAHATMVCVAFALDRDRFRIAISDDGRGADTMNTNGLGIKNMRMRTAAINGKIDWYPNTCADNGLVRGLTVKVSIPIHHDREPPPLFPETGQPEREMN